MIGYFRSGLPRRSFSKDGSIEEKDINVYPVKYEVDLSGVCVCLRTPQGGIILNGSAAKNMKLFIFLCGLCERNLFYLSPASLETLRLREKISF